MTSVVEEQSLQCEISVVGWVGIMAVGCDA